MKVCTVAALAAFVLLGAATARAESVAAGDETGSTSLPQQDSCAVPDSLLAGEGQLTRVADAVKQTRRLVIAVVGTGSSVLGGPEGVSSAYPARLESVLRKRLLGVEVQVVPVVKPRATAEEMADSMEKLVGDLKPSLVIWQTGTVDAMRSVDADGFRWALEEGVESLQAGGADVVLMNMQYSPRTETMIAVSSYIDNMRWVSQQRSVPVFDRLAIMRHWNDAGSFDFHAATKDQGMARRVHDCIGHALARLVIETAHLETYEAKAPR
jgi:hypothetical protein